MADESDVEQTLVGLINGYLYPNGTAQACAAGVPCQIFRGWPVTQQQELAKAQAAPGNPGLVNVSVTARNGVENKSTRHPPIWQTITPPAHSLTASVIGALQNQIEIGGTVAVPQNIVALIGGSLEPKVFVYAVQASDTLATVATGLASAIASAFPGTTSSGAVVSVASTLPLAVRVASSGIIIQEVGRATKSFQVTIWAPPYNVSGGDADLWRNAVAKIVDPQLRSLNRILLPDHTNANIAYERTISFDLGQMQGLYRRDLYYSIEYATTITQTAYEIGAAVSQLQGGVTNTGVLPVNINIPPITINS